MARRSLLFSIDRRGGKCLALNSGHALFIAVALHGTAVVAQASATAPEDSLYFMRARDAYLDETARRLVLGLKSVRDTALSDIEAYTALVRERVGVEFPAHRRDRPWMHGERAARFRWSRREPTVVRVLGARFRDPVLGSGNSQLFPGLRTERFAVDPMGDPFHFAFGLFVSSSDAEAPARSPLETASERNYRFRSGDTVTVRFDDDRTLSAVAVTAIPRYRSARLVSAIMWIDPDSFRLVRVAYRPAKKMDREMSWRLMADGGLRMEWTFDLGAADPSEAATTESEPAPDSSSDDEGLFARLVNGAFDNAMPRHEADISVVFVDYGLWEMRHWLPRAVRLRGYMRAADVTANEVAPPLIRAMIDWTLEVESVSERGAEVAPGVPATAADALRLWRQEGDSVGGVLGGAGPGETITVTPSNRQALESSDLLPPTLWEEDRSVVDDADAEIAVELATIGSADSDGEIEGPSPWFFDPPGKTLRLLRYNPVERLSVGTRLQRDWTWGSAALTARVGTARLEPPDVDLTLQRDRPSHRMLLSFYRALRDVRPQGDEAPGVFATGDASDFHWSHGASLRLLPSARDRSWLSLRLFAERDAGIGTADRRNRVGAAATWRPWWGGADIGAVGGGGRASVHVSRGDRPHVRAVVEAAAVIPLAERVSMGLQVGSARVWGDPATQDLWRIGDNGGWLRGHAETVRAARVEMARLDVQRQIGFLRLSVFADWASTGGRDFQALGAGLVLMEGMMRLDMVRGLGRETQNAPEPVLRLHLWGDAFF